MWWIVGEGVEYSLCGFLRLVAKAEIYKRDVGTIKEEIRQVKTELFRREWRRKKRSVYTIKVGSCHGETKTKQLLKEVDRKIYFSGNEKFIITERQVQAQRAMG